jgi:hypothetical protein
MSNIAILAFKGLAGGALVVAFAVISEGLTPKRFAGLFSAAPAVALAGLSIVLLDKGHHPAHEEAIGMVAGAGGMLLYAAVVIPLLRRFGAKRAAALGLGGWIVGAGLLALPVLLP